jgi:hypothetical protein
VEFVSHLWRPIVATALMYIGIRVLGPALPVAALSPKQATASLMTCIALGVPLYAISIAGLWWLSGRPEDSAESFVLQKVPQVWNGVRARAGI